MTYTMGSSSFNMIAAVKSGIRDMSACRSFGDLFEGRRAEGRSALVWLQLAIKNRSNRSSRQVSSVNDTTILSIVNSNLQVPA